MEGSSCKVILGVKGYPLPSTSWFFMGTEVDYGNSFKANISPTGNATLEIIKLTKDLVGEYKCTAENEHGTATKVVRLQLAGKETWKVSLCIITNIMKKHQIYIKTCKVVKSFECQNYFGVYSILQTYISYDLSF